MDENNIIKINRKKIWNLRIIGASKLDIVRVLHHTLASLKKATQIGQIGRIDNTDTVTDTDTVTVTDTDTGFPSSGNQSGIGIGHGIGIGIGHGMCW